MEFATEPTVVIPATGASGGDGAVVVPVIGVVVVGVVVVGVVVGVVVTGVVVVVVPTAPST